MLLLTGVSDQDDGESMNVLGKRRGRPSEKGADQAARGIDGRMQVVHAIGLRRAC